LNPTQIPFSPQEPEFSFQSHEPFHDSLNPAFEQPFSSFTSTSAIPQVDNDISSTDNMLAALVPNPFPSSYMFSEEREHLFTLPLQPLSTTVDASISYPSVNWGDQFGQPAAPVMTDFRSDTGSVATINHLPWDDPTHEAKTISGGTFISGNVNYIHATMIQPSKIPISIVLHHFYLGF
jgi:hypothetical protein